jgi:hypothetical protein
MSCHDACSLKGVPYKLPLLFILNCTCQVLQVLEQLVRSGDNLLDLDATLPLDSPQRVHQHQTRDVISNHSLCRAPCAAVACVA